MSFYNKDIGRIGEKLAVDYLLSNGFDILTLNYASPLGEIDIVAEKDLKLHFIEVKTRVGIKKGYPYEAVNFIKRKHLKGAVNHYIIRNKVKDKKLSLNVFSIILDQDKNLVDLKFYEFN